MEPTTNPGTGMNADMNTAAPAGAPKDDKNKRNITIAAVVLLVAVLVVVLYFVGISTPSQDEEKILNEMGAQFNKNNLTGVIDSADTILKTDNKNIEALLSSAIAWAQRGSLEFKEAEYGGKAEAIAREILVIDSQNADAYRVIGYSYEIRQQYDQAISAYNQAIMIDGNQALAISQKGHAYDLFGDHEKSKSFYKEALEINPLLEHALINYGKALFRDGNNDEAEVYLNNVLKTSANVRFRAEAEQLLGVLSLYRGDFAGAKIHFENAIKIDENLAVAWVGLAETIYLTLPDDEEKFSDNIMLILQKAERATRINPNQTTAYLIVGKTLLLVDDKKQARGVLEKALATVDADITLGVMEKESISKEIKKYLEKT